MSGLLASVGIAASLTYVAAMAALWLAQSRIVFQPGTPAERMPMHTPADAGLEYESVVLHAADGVRLAGWYVPGPRPDSPVVLFCHGNAGNIGDRIETLTALHEIGAATLIFDYRGFGASEGRPSEKGLRRDARAAWDWLTEARSVPSARIVLYGRSLGGAVAAGLGAETRPAGLVLESTFTSLPDLAARLYPWAPARWLSRYRFDTAARLAHVGAPVLVAHSPEDEVIPFAHAERLAAMRPPAIALERLRGSHDEAFPQARATFLAALERFLAQTVPEPVHDD